MQELEWVRPVIVCPTQTDGFPPKNCATWQFCGMPLVYDGVITPAHTQSSSDERHTTPDEFSRLVI